MKRKIMKKMFLFIVSLVFAISNITAATVNISGSVTPGLTISILAEPIAQNLDLTTSTTIKIATVTEISNIKLFKISILSTLGGSFVGNVSGATQSYTLSYYETGTTTGITITPTSVYQDVLLATSRTHPAGDDKDLFISYTIVPDVLPADTYEDTIVIRIEAQ